MRKTSWLFLILPFLLFACEDSPHPIAPEDGPEFHKGPLDEPGTPSPSIPGAPNTGGGNHSHWRYGHLTYRSIGPSTVEFTYQNAFRRSGYSGTAGDGRPAIGDIITEFVGGTSLCFGDGSCTGTLSYEVTGISPDEDWLFAEALHPGTTDRGIIHTYSIPGPVTATSFSCCRIGGLENSGTDYGVQTRVVLGASSPSSSLPPIVRLEEGGVREFVVPMATGSGNSLRCRNSVSSERGGGLQPGQLSVVSTNPCRIQFDATNESAGDAFWTQQTIEELDSSGNVIKTVALDYLIILSEAGAEPPQTTTSSPQNISTGPGGNVSFSVSFSTGGGGPASFSMTPAGSSGSLEAANGSTISVSVVGVPEGADVGCDSPAPLVTCDFSWTPGPDQTGTFVITFIATTSDGAQTFISFTIEVTGEEQGPQTCPDAIAALQDAIDAAPGLSETTKEILKRVVSRANRGGVFLELIGRATDRLLELDQITEEQAAVILDLVENCLSST